MPASSPTTSTSIAIGHDVRLTLQSNAAGDFIGIGDVTICGVAMRHSGRPIVVRLDTPDGILYPRLELREIVPGGAAGGTTRVRLLAHGVRWERAEYADDYDQVTHVLGDTVEPVVDELELLFSPCTETIGDTAFTGYSFAMRFISPARRIHRILTHATWEIGGRITGATVLQQGQCNMPVYEGAVDRLFTTACLRTLDRYGSNQGNSFQLGPRGGLLQGFDLQVAAAGALLHYWPQLDSISSLVESPPGSDRLHVIDEYRFALTSDVTTTAQRILFAPGALAEHEARDLWWEVREHAYGLVRQRFGVTLTRVLPEVAMYYRSRVENGKLRFSIMDEEVDSTEVSRLIAERLLPHLAEQGIRRFFPEVQSQSDVTEYGMRRKLDAGIHGDLHCASVCATHRFLPADFWGGMAGWRQIYDSAKALDMELGAWFAPHFSPRSPYYAAHPEYAMTGPNGLPAGGGYGFQTLVVADWNTGVYEEVLADLKRWKEEGGLDFLFVDSLSNMGLLQINYAADMRTNYEALGRLVGDIQRLGIKSLTCECISPLHASRFGLADLRGDLIGQDRSVAGQNDFGWWYGQEDMAWNSCLYVAPRKRSTEDIERALFRAIASGGYLSYQGIYKHDHTLPEWWTRLNRLMQRAEPAMLGRRRLLPGRQGVRWEDENGRTRAVWSFADVALALPANATLTRLDQDGTTATAVAVPVAPGGQPTTLPAWTVHLVD